MTYKYTDVKKRAGKAFTTIEVANLVNRTRLTIELYIMNGIIDRPQMTYNLESRRPFKFMWSEDDVMKLHEYLSTVHIGRPRKDGEITTRDMPNARELRAIMRQEAILYVRNKDGEFVPTWQAEQF